MRFQTIRILYPENVSRFRHSSSLKWYSVGHIHLASTFFSCLDTRKEGKRKSRPLPRPGKLAGYMMKIKKRDAFCAFAILGMAPGGAYAIRPYPDGRKIITPKPCYLVGSVKRAAFRTCYLVGSAKRTAFGTCYLVGGAKRAAFRTCYLVGSAKRAAFGTCYLVGSVKRAAFGTSILVGGAKRAAFGTCILDEGTKRAAFESSI